MLWNVRVAILRIFNITWCSRNIDIQKMRPIWVNDFSGRIKWNGFRFSLAVTASHVSAPARVSLLHPRPAVLFPVSYPAWEDAAPSWPPCPPLQRTQGYSPLLTSPSLVLPFALQIGKHESPEFIWLPCMCQEQGRVVTQHCPTLLFSVL